MNTILKALIVFLPWRWKRAALIKLYKYEISPKSKIGLSWIFPSHLIMEEHSIIGHFNVAIHLDKLQMGEYCIISRSNWITGYSIRKKRHFNHKLDRRSELILKKHSAITKKHLIDCTDSITIGEFTTISGYNSQFLTHSINLRESIQDCYPIEIGSYCLVGTNTVILGGSVLPDYSVLAAMSLLNKNFDESYFIYGGVPAKPIKEIDSKSKYFSRNSGFIA